MHSTRIHEARSESPFLSSRPAFPFSRLLLPPRVMSSSSDDVTVNGFDSPTRADSGAANGFTAVNGKATSPRRLVNGINGTHAAHHSSPKTIEIHPARMDVQAAPAADANRVDSAPAARASPADDASVNTGKRKRSISEGDGREPPGEQGEYAPPEKRRTPQPQPPPQSQQPQPQPGQQNSWETSPPQGMTRVSNHSMSYSTSDPESRDGWYGPSTQRPQSQSNDEATLIETIRNAMPNVSPHGQPTARDYSGHMDVHGGTPQHLVSGTIETTAAGVQVDPKKRKRVSELTSRLDRDFWSCSADWSIRSSVIAPRLAARRAGNERRSAMKASRNARIANAAVSSAKATQTRLLGPSRLIYRADRLRQCFNPKTILAILEV